MMSGEVDLEAAYRRHMYSKISTHSKRNADWDEHSRPRNDVKERKKDQKGCVLFSYTVAYKRRFAPDIVPSHDIGQQ